MGKALGDISVTIFGTRRYVDTGVFLNADSIDQKATFSYKFRFEDSELVYRYARFSNQELRDEELFINGRTIFSCNFENNEFNFKNLEYVNAETASIDRYLQSVDIGDEEELQESKLPFLRWLLSNVALSNDSILIKLDNYVRRMLMITAGNAMAIGKCLWKYKASKGNKMINRSGNGGEKNGRKTYKRNSGNHG